MNLMTDEFDDRGIPVRVHRLLHYRKKAEQPIYPSRSICVRIAIYIAILACAASLAVVGQNADLGAKSKILALEYAWDQAQERGDIKALSAIFDNSLMFVDYDGQVRQKPNTWLG
jgi:hypothetical protein